MAPKKSFKSTAAAKSPAKAAPLKKAAPQKAAVRKPAVKKPAAVKAPAAPKAPAAAKTAPAKPAPDRHEIQRRIRVAAYYKYLKRGGRGGSQYNDWQEAEKEVIARLK